MKTAQDIFDEILKARGITNLDTFAHPDYASLADPYLLPDVKPALARLEKAIKNNETIAIYGDYDIDGLTATTILAEALRAHNLSVEMFIPDRFRDGYGMSNRGIDELKSKGVSLLFTVDTGSLSHDHVKYAAAQGIDVIVTDHHTVGETLPEAVAVINPKRKDSKYPYRDMAGVGVAFTFIRAMQKKFKILPEGHEKWYLDLVALGTVCDVVPLTGENRVLVYWGLKVMQKTRRAGLKALAQVSGTELSDIDTMTFGFRFGPRLNASGRLDHAKLSLDVLHAETLAEAVQLAEQLDAQNSERRGLQTAIFDEALQQADTYKDDPVLILAGVTWSHGVVGIVAAKFVEQFAKPTFILQIEGDLTKGSARSFGDFHLAEVIAKHKKLLQKGGGHSYAAGVTLETVQLDAFRKAVNEYYRSLNLENQAELLRPIPDLWLDSFEGLSLDLVALLALLEPYGTEHERPRFGVRSVKLTNWRPVGADQKHAKATFTDKKGAIIDGIGFGIAERMPEIGSTIDIVFNLESNTWNERTSLQAQFIDVIKSKVA